MLGVAGEVTRHTARCRAALFVDVSESYVNFCHRDSLGQLLWPWCASVRLCASAPRARSSNSDVPLIVSAEAAHVAARRHINLVNIPDFIASPPVEQVKGVT
jgi:hypothetical protein